MTATELNAAFAGILDEIAHQIEVFDKLRTEASDDAWDEACTVSTIADLLSDLEWGVDEAVRQVKV